eukprot:11585767-Prorocentrum_lima.AAC.1
MFHTGAQRAHCAPQLRTIEHSPQLRNTMFRTNGERGALWSTAAEHRAQSTAAEYYVSHKCRRGAL